MLGLGCWVLVDRIKKCHVFLTNIFCDKRFFTLGTSKISMRGEKGVRFGYLALGGCPLKFLNFHYQGICSPLLDVKKFEKS